eukprot:TRINITY_DN1164_c0_g1_i11.p1 TRINITY_DN1164_c0_g1~~TRINITY_DN1164_c0_g1_i11.p1  ORF type:complete len:288 (-),score=45.86 TRINITY_DN1164_c0_g1_i11:12-875(-)
MMHYTLLLLAIFAISVKGQNCTLDLCLKPSCTEAGNECLQCEENYFIDNDNLTDTHVCSPCPPCSRFSYQQSNCTGGKDIDRVCATCTMCKEGETELSGCLPFADAVCSPNVECELPLDNCIKPACTEAGIQCLQCEENWFIDNGNLTDRHVCSPCPPCSRNTWQASNCTGGRDIDRQCSPCTSCKEGEIEISGCLPYADRVCAPNPNATCEGPLDFCITPSCTEAGIKCLQCEENYFIDNNGNLTDTHVCSPCPPCSRFSFQQFNCTGGEEIDRVCTRMRIPFYRN